MTTNNNDFSSTRAAEALHASACSLDLGLLARSKTVPEINTWLEKTMLARTKASSCVLLWGRAEPTVKFVPIFISDGFPKDLLDASMQNARLTTAAYLPLYWLWKEFESPIISKLEDLSHEHHGDWHIHFQRRAIRKVCASGCLDANGHYQTYLYLTDPYAMSDQEVKSLLAVITPVIHSILVQVRRRKRQNRKNVTQSLLTARELEVLEWVRKGKTNPEISKILGVTFPTIKNHIQKIMIKLRVNNRAEAVGKAYGLNAQDTHLLDSHLRASDNLPKKPRP